MPTNPNNPYSVALKVEDLLPLISSETRIIAFTACSNILGTIVPVKEIIKAARADAKEKCATKVKFSIDCVAYAPHRLIDVQDWDADFCFFSLYKVRYLRRHMLFIHVPPTRSTARTHQLFMSVRKFFELLCLP